MRFNRSEWKLKRREWTPRKLAGAARAVKREQASIPLFPELARYKTTADRIAETDGNDAQRTMKMRAFQAVSWRKARRLIQSLPPLTRKGMLRHWQQSPCPADPSYLLGTIREHLQTGFSPWSWLRFHKQMQLVGAGKLARHHLNETWNQHQYGQYPWLKLDQKRNK